MMADFFQAVFSELLNILCMRFFGAAVYVLVQALVGIPLVGLRMPRCPVANFVFVDLDLPVLDPGIELRQHFRVVVFADPGIDPVIPTVKAADQVVAVDVAVGAAYAGRRSLAVMKHVGVNVAADFLLHLAEYGTRRGLVLVSCEDPGALSSTNEGDSRPYCKMMEFPLIEPADFQEAKDMVKWAFELSEELQSLVMLRSVTRLSHASGDVTFGELPEAEPTEQANGSGPPTIRMHPARPC